MPNPKISVVIPSLNKGQYIKRTLDSIFRQDYDNFEVVVMDGGSTDQTLQILETFSKKYPTKIIVQSKKDAGQAAAVNEGFTKTRGDVITYINADDFYIGQVFSKVSNAYNSKTEWYLGGGIVVDEKDNEIYKFVSLYKNILMKINSYGLLLIVNYMMQPSVFISRSAYNKFGPFSGNKRFITEYEMWLKIGKESMPVLINDKTSAFRIYTQSITGSDSNTLLKEDEKIVKIFTDNKFYLFLHKINNLARKIVHMMLRKK